MLGAGGDPHEDLVHLHVVLLRNLNMKKTIVTKKNWEKSLANFCLTTVDYNKEGFELHELGYQKLCLSLRIHILKGLMEAQFDWNIKLKDTIDEMTIEEMRQEPTGRDADGQNYWVQVL